MKAGMGALRLETDIQACMTDVLTWKELPEELIKVWIRYPTGLMKR